MKKDGPKIGGLGKPNFPRMPRKMSTGKRGRGRGRKGGTGVSGKEGFGTFCYRDVHKTDDALETRLRPRTKSGNFEKKTA